jgi:hypothetical protein
MLNNISTNKMLIKVPRQGDSSPVTLACIENFLTVSVCLIIRLMLRKQTLIVCLQLRLLLLPLLSFKLECLSVILNSVINVQGKVITPKQWFKKCSPKATGTFKINYGIFTQKQIMKSAKISTLRHRTVNIVSYILEEIYYRSYISIPTVKIIFH